MNARAPGLLAAIASILLVVAFVVWDSKQVSPGDISRVHAEIAGIAERDCAACHGAAHDELRKACAACHAEIEEQVTKHTGFHGRTIADASRCGSCHGEHHGRDFTLVSAATFGMSGVPDRDAFRHAALDFHLAGKHETLDCKACHSHADDVLLARDTQRFLGASQACTTCHHDPHAGKLADCASCHGQEEPFEHASGFRHTDAFPLRGAHAGVACVDCHPANGPRSIAGSAAELARDPGAVRSCAECHASPHAPTFLAAVASPNEAATTQGCVRCHAVERGGFTTGAKLTRAEHAALGFPLTAPHDSVACAACHSPRDDAEHAPSGARADFHVAHPARASADCAACHSDPHGGQFSRDRIANGCIACHATTRFTPTSFGIEQHRHAGFPLDGAHAAVECSRCHTQPDSKSPRRFRDTSSDCAACHADVHGGAFDRPGVAAVVDGRSGCARCHTTDSFTTGSTRGFDHGRWTRFVLEGAHATAACSTCHAAPVPAERGERQLGLASRKVAASACAACHADPHSREFERRNSDCATCHSTTSFAAARSSFDHGTATAFALDGAHARAACTSCHPSLGTQAPIEVVHSRDGAPSDCRTCHSDVHDGAFDRNLPGASKPDREGCARCHSTDSFHSVTEFDHATWTGFALVGAHSTTACSACHAPVVDSHGETRGFAHATGRACADCHADPHAGQFSRDGRTRCETCHADSTSFARLQFDHTRDTRFALDATHAALDCGACHRPAPLKSGRTAVRYKPLGTSCVDCHDPRGGGVPR